MQINKQPVTCAASTFLLNLMNLRLRLQPPQEAVRSMTVAALELTADLDILRSSQQGTKRVKPVLEVKTEERSGARPSRVCM